MVETTPLRLLATRAHVASLKGMAMTDPERRSLASVCETTASAIETPSENERALLLMVRLAIENQFRPVACELLKIHVRRVTADIAQAAQRVGPKPGPNDWTTKQGLNGYG